MYKTTYKSTSAFTLTNDTLLFEIFTNGVDSNTNITDLRSTIGDDENGIE